MFKLMGKKIISIKFPYLDLCIWIYVFGQIIKILVHISCKSGNFCENFIFANSVKRQTCDIKNLRLGHDLPISVINRMISRFCEDFIFTKLCI